MPFLLGRRPQSLMLRLMPVSMTEPGDVRRARWVAVLVGTALAVTVALGSFSAALMLAIRTEDLRLTFLLLLACGGALLALPRLWRWLTLAWYVGLGAFGALLHVIASQPNYGDLLTR